MEIIYFIKVIMYIFEYISYMNYNFIEMKGGNVLTSAIKSKPGELYRVAKSKASNLASAATSKASNLASAAISKPGELKAAAESKAIEGSEGAKDSIKSQVLSIYGMSTSSERIKSRDASVGLYMIISFIVKLFAWFLVPFMPFYSATKSLFNNGIPLFKEVVIPESVDYELKILEEEALKNKQQGV